MSCAVQCGAVVPAGQHNHRVVAMQVRVAQRVDLEEVITSALNGLDLTLLA